MLSTQTHSTHYVSSHLFADNSLESSKSRIASRGKMKFFLLFACLAIGMVKSKILRPEEHWRPASPIDFSKYEARLASDVQMAKVERLAREMPASGTFSSLKDSGKPRSNIGCGIQGPAANLEAGRIVGGDEATAHAWPWTVLLLLLLLL